MFKVRPSSDVELFTNESDSFSLVREKIDVWIVRVAHMNFDCGATLFQKSHFLWAESKCEKSVIIYFD